MPVNEIRLPGYSPVPISGVESARAPGWSRSEFAARRTGCGVAGKAKSGRPLRACFKNRRGPVFPEKVLWRGATRESRGCGMTKEQRSQRTFSGKTLRAAVLLPGSRVGSTVTARSGDAPVSPPWPRPKSLVAGLLPFFKQALRVARCGKIGPGRVRPWRPSI
jgi:hypothetical protein